MVFISSCIRIPRNLARINVVNFSNLLSPNYSLNPLQTMPFYAVAKGRPNGIYETWAECKAAIDGVAHAKFKKFESRDLAQAFIDQFKGKVKATTYKVLEAPAEPPPVVEEIIDLDLASEFDSEDLFNDGLEDLFTDHMTKIDTMVDSFRNSVLEEVERFKHKILQQNPNGTIIPQSTSNALAKGKRKSTEVKEQKPNKRTKYELPVDEDGFVHVFTDGACENNGRVNAKAGLGVWFGDNHPLNLSEPVKGRATNNVGEIQACTRAILVAHEAGVEKLCINTDSQFVINSITTWLPNWKKRGWKLKDGGDVKNKYDFIDLEKATNLLEVKFNYVKGHAGIAGNEGADQLARDGAQRYGH